MELFVGALQAALLSVHRDMFVPFPSVMCQLLNGHFCSGCWTNDWLRSSSKFVPPSEQFVRDVAALLIFLCAVLILEIELRISFPCEKYSCNSIFYATYHC